MLKKHINRSNDILDLYGGSGNFSAYDGTENLDIEEYSSDYDGTTEALDIAETDSNYEFAVNALQRQGRFAEVRALKKMRSQAIQGRKLRYAVQQNAQRSTGRSPLGTITLIAKRVSANIPESLPFVFFGRNSADNFYRDLIVSPVLPAGVTLTNVTIGNTFATAGKVVFEYTDSATPTPRVDTVEVTLKSNRLTYTQLLAYLYTNMLELSKMKIKLSSIAGNSLSQQDNPYSLARTSMFAKGEGNEFIPTDWKLAQQNENGILDVNFSAKIDQERAIVGSIIDIAGFSVTHSFYCDAVVMNRAS